MTAHIDPELAELGGRGILRPGKFLRVRTIAWLLALGLAVAIVIGIASPLARHDLRTGADAGRVLLQAAFATTALVIYAVAVHFGERRRPIELDLRRAAPELAGGLALGGALIGVVILILVAAGAYELTGPRSASPWGALSLAVESAVLEELLFRAILFRLLMLAFGPVVALALSAVLFGALHLTSPEATLLAGAAIAVEAGVLLPLVFLLTGRLWLPIGVHFGWNFCQSFMFGSPVSGVVVGDSIFTSSPVRGVPAAISGGTFGPEASLPALAAGTVLVLICLVGLRRQRPKLLLPEKA